MTYGSLGVTDQRKVVVIGAGMGGLAAAIRLNAAGCAVTVIEMADGPGGKARAVPSVAGPVDCGPTVLTLRHVADDLFALCGTRMEDEVDLITLPRLARHFWPDGSTLDLFADPEASYDAIRAFSSVREAEAFRRFDGLTRALFQAFDAPLMRAAKPSLPRIAVTAAQRPALWPALLPGLTLDGFLRRRFSDPRLVQLFGRYATYVGGRPSHSPAVLSLIWQAEAAGVWAVRQGMHGLAAALARVAAARGVRFRYATKARRILRQNNRVSGVELDQGSTLPCEICIFNGDPAALQDNLLGEAPRDALPKGRMPPSLSAWVWAFAARPQGVDLAHHNVFFTADPAQEFGPIGQGQMPLAPTLYVCAQDRELGQPPPAIERFEIIMNGPAGHPSFRSEDMACQSRTFPMLRAQGLTFSALPDRAALTTPALLAQSFPGSQGAIYGGSPEGGLAAFRRPLATTGLAGLYLAGGGTHPGAGVPMALLSGQHAATAAMAAPTSGSRSAPAAMRGGISTASRTTTRAPSR
ncbi:1-hydroxycarotenoid 3,4-desaturase CrtD [Pseudotabrizicola sp. L79]|uniref:1-hydroxycarotenoid 3,4-desaturase CrtD n=1 Tax=Pseudotabrizicola sp. L79 TaxID=3118402 RepID=UPI002F925710